MVFSESPAMICKVARVVLYNLCALLARLLAVEGIEICRKRTEVVAALACTLHLVDAEAGWQPLPLNAWKPPPADMFSPRSSRELGRWFFERSWLETC